MANLLVAIWIVRILPQEFYRAILRWYFDTFHRVRVTGLENYHAAGDRVVIVANHQSYLDALPDRGLPARQPHLRHPHGAGGEVVFQAVPRRGRYVSGDVQSPYAVKRMVEAVRDHGRKLMIFPEGRMTRTGALMKIYEGAALVADKSHAKIVPISIEGPQFSRLEPHGRQAAAALVPPAAAEHPAAGDAGAAGRRGTDAAPAPRGRSAARCRT